MNLSTNLRLAWRLTLRDWRSGELTIMLLSLMIAVAGTTTVSLLSDRLGRTMESQAAEFLAADLVVSAHEPVLPAWWAEAAKRGLAHAATVEFPSVLVENDELLLVGVKAVGSGYPLRGQVFTSDGDPATEHVTAGGPPAGEAWADSRVLSTLHVRLRDRIQVGEYSLLLTRVITREPDRRGDLYSLSPRVMINLQDLEATRVIQPGSHAHYYGLFAGDEPSVRDFKRWLKPRLHPGQRVVDIHEDRPEIGNALSRAERYLGLASIVIVVIAGVAIAMSARRYTERHFDLSAMLRCLGARGRDVLSIHAAQYLMVGLAGGLGGTGFGYLAQLAVAHWLRQLLPQALSPPSWYAPVFGLATGFFVLLGFALPAVLRLTRLPPMRVLRRDLAPLPPAAWFVHGLGLMTVAALVWAFTGDARLTGIALTVGAAALAVGALLAYGLLLSLRGLSRGLGLAWRFGLQNLTRNPRLAVTQILAFGLTLTAMLLGLLIRTELLQEWRNQLPQNAPNHFALNLMSAELSDFKAFLASEQITASAYYPIVRGRLTEINGTDVHRRAHKDSEGEGAINRELSLTYAPDLPADNHLVRGRWWQSGESRAQVSVEEKLAASLGIELGDVLSFSVGGQRLDAVVTSLRKVRWDTMSPNFYMIFAPGSLDGYPQTYLTSFFVSAEQQGVLTRLVKAFPSITLLDVEALLRQFQLILQQISTAIEFVLTLALAAGFAVLFAAVGSSLDERMFESALLRSMGASNSLLRRSLGLEFVALGALSGLLASIVAELIAWLLFLQVFDMAPRMHWAFWLATPMVGALGVGLAGYLHTRAIVRNSPVAVLREL